MFRREVSDSKNKMAILFAIGILILSAFIQCYRTAHDVKWFYDQDFYRDMAGVQGILDGNFGKDPNYEGAYPWYNPMLTSIETLIVKISALPINIVLAHSGVYLNLLAPLAFVLMLVVLFDIRIALASLLSFLFFAPGNLPGYYAATYSPWLYPVCFAQFFFYLNIIFCYKAFSTQRYSWFFTFGSCTGLCFLTHNAPAVLSILIVCTIQIGFARSAIGQKNYLALRKYMLQGIIAFVPFAVASLPLLYIIVWKYHLHIINRFPFEYEDTIFIGHNFLDMIRANASISFLVAVGGFIAFYRQFRGTLIRKIFLDWLIMAVFMYLYSTIAVTMDNHFGIHLPLTVPSFHYFFYLKALQSVFFGFGLVALLRYLAIRLKRLSFVREQRAGAPVVSTWAFLSVVLCCALLYFPVYKNRKDFSYFRDQNLKMAKDSDGIELYNYILKTIPSNNVILCEGDGKEYPTSFPVMASARKTVSLGPTYSNPFFDWIKRESDRNNMILFFRTGEPAEAKKLYQDYHVEYVLLTNEALKGASSPWIINQIEFRNNTYTLFNLGGQGIHFFESKESSGMRVQFMIISRLNRGPYFWIAQQGKVI
jgi:hypothetical protein